MCLGFSLLIHIGTLCQSFNLLLSSGVVGYVAFLSRKMSCLKGNLGLGRDGGMVFIKGF